MRHLANVSRLLRLPAMSAQPTPIARTSIHARTTIASSEHVNTPSMPRHATTATHALRGTTACKARVLVLRLRAVEFSRLTPTRTVAHRALTHQKATITNSLPTDPKIPALATANLRNQFQTPAMKNQILRLRLFAFRESPVTRIPLVTPTKTVCLTGRTNARIRELEWT